MDHSISGDLFSMNKGGQPASGVNSESHKEDNNKTATNSNIIPPLNNHRQGDKVKEISSSRCSYNQMLNPSSPMVSQENQTLHTASKKIIPFVLNNNLWNNYVSARNHDAINPSKITDLSSQILSTNDNHTTSTDKTSSNKTVPTSFPDSHCDTKKLQKNTKKDSVNLYIKPPSKKSIHKPLENQRINKQKREQ